MILHIPHASRHIPEALRGQFVLDDHALGEELARVTDAFTDELFDFPGCLPGRIPSQQACRRRGAFLS